MSEHVAGMIADCQQKIAQLTDIVVKLEWFQREFPHTAAAIVPIEKPPRKYARRAVVAKPQKAKRLLKRTDGRSKHRANAQRGASLTKINHARFSMRSRLPADR